MPDFTRLIQSGSAHVWLYIPAAILLGALHGLEPGHSKTMMAAFIIAIRGTVWQAVLLGLSAAVSHSLLIWVLASLALVYGSRWNAEHMEPYFHIASALMVLGLALWMFLRTRREVAEAHAHEHRHQVLPAAGPAPTPSPGGLSIRERAAASVAALAHGGEPGAWAAAGHVHAGAPALIAPGPGVSGTVMRQGPHGGMLLDTGHGWLEVCILPDGHGDGRFHIYPCKASGAAVPLPRGTQVSIETARLDGTTQKFAFESGGDHWRSTSGVPSPHEFLATVSLGHSDHFHTYRLRFVAAQDPHAKAPLVVEEPEEDGGEYEDAHQRAHAQDIARRFGNRAVTTGQIVMFGITGGLMPCPAAFTVLLVCLQVKRVTLGFTLVAAFSFGLALTMVVVGVIAAWSVGKAHRKFSGLGNWMRRAPYLSCVLLVVLAAFMLWQGWSGLRHGHMGHSH